jgi:iron(III) transport system permease protein
LAIGTVALLLLGVFFLYPLVLVLSASVFTPDGAAFTLQNYVKVLSRPFYRASLFNSVTIGGTAALTTTAMALPLAFIVSRLAIAGKTLLIALATLPLVLPSFVAAYAIVLLFGRNGIVTHAMGALGLASPSIYGAPGIVLVYTLTLYPYVLLPCLTAFKAVEADLEEAAQSLGSSRWRSLRTVTLPLIVPSVLAGALLVFIESLENFGVPAVLAEDRPILAIEAYKLFVGETDTNPAAAGVLGVVLVVTAAAALLLQRRFLSGRSFATSARRPAVQLQVPRLARRLAAAFAWGIVLAALVPFFAVLVLSFMEFHGPVLTARLSLGNYVSFLEKAGRPLANTLLFATLAALGVTVLGVPIGHVVTRTRTRLASLLDVLATLPFAVAGTVLAIGLIVAFNGGVLPLTGGWLILVLAYVVRKLPFGVRTASAGLYQIDAALEEASISLGVAPARTLIVLVVPLLLGSIATSLALTWVTIASELSATVVLYTGPWQTLSILMYQSLEGSGAGLAVAVASVLIAIALAPVAILFALVRQTSLAPD